MKKLLLLTAIALVLINYSVMSQAILPFTGCPNTSIAVVRAGTNTDITNPYFMYTVNTGTGAMTVIPGGPLLGPGAPSANLQVNGVGLNRVDGFLYGLTFDGTSNTARIVRIDRNYGVTLTPNIAPPSSATGIYGFVNPTAGDCDRLNNYYFTGFTANPGIVPGTLILDKLFIGKIDNISTYSSGTPTALYYEIDFADVPCLNFVNALIVDPQNVGFRDIVYNPVTNIFATYITYKVGGSPTWSGQYVELRPLPGVPLKYKMFCSSVVNSHPAEVAGTLIDNVGNFEILFNDGQMGKIASTGVPFNYNGVYSTLNPAPGVPNPLRGDLASCGGPTGGPLPVKLTSFNAVQKDCRIDFSWTSETELNLSHYELEQSFDAKYFSAVSNISLTSNKTYKTTTASPGQPAYYRVKGIDKDGKYTYSVILSVANLCNSNNRPGFLISPNPVKDVLNLGWYGIPGLTVMKINIYNNLGSQVKNITKSVTQGNTFGIDVSSLPAGIYYIKSADTRNNTVIDAKFLKQ